MEVSVSGNPTLPGLLPLKKLDVFQRFSPERLKNLLGRPKFILLRGTFFIRAAFRSTLLSPTVRFCAREGTAVRDRAGLVQCHESLGNWLSP